MKKTFKDKNILVTGGAGFIGSAVIRYLIRETGHAVAHLDALAHARNLDSLVEAASTSCRPARGAVVSRMPRPCSTS